MALLGIAVFCGLALIGLVLLRVPRYRRFSQRWLGWGFGVEKDRRRDEP
jgi:hypothetical protein